MLLTLRIIVTTSNRNLRSIVLNVHSKVLNAHSEVMNAHSKVMNEIFLYGKINFFLITTKTFPKINTKLILEGGRKEIKGGEKRNKERKEIKGIRK